MNYKISKRAATLSPSLTLAIDSKAKQMKADGQDVVGFGAGEPDFDTPQHIKDAAAKALADGFTKYTPASGIPELRQAIADKFKALGDICVEKGVLIMSDEIYEHLLYDGATHKSVASFSPAHYDHTIVVHGFAKAWSMTGWRLGFLAAPEPIAKAIDAIQSHSTSNPTSFAQKGGVAALTGPQDHLPEWLAEYDKRRAYAWEKLNSIPGMSCCNARGAFYLFPNISGLGLKSTDFCARLLEQEKVAAVPGIAFGADDYLRLSYATSMANIEKGLERIGRFCRSLKK